MDIERYIKGYWSCVAAQCEEKLREYFGEDACIRWHNTNEQFNVAEFMRANCDYPGSWNGEVERFEQLGNTIVTVTRIWAEDISFHVTSFFEMSGGRIKALDEYWGDDGMAPQWRQEKHIGKPIR